MAVVEMQHLGKVYPDRHRAVDDIDLTIDDGEFFVIVGPSGCGKTSVLRMVAGLEDVTEGDIVVDGVSVGATKTNRRDLAMLFQTTALYPHMTVRANIGFPLKIARVRHGAITKQVDAMARSLGLTDKLELRPKHLSGGERQRVAMGRAMIRDPALLLMDEPMSNLDAKMRTELRGEIALAQRRLGVTTLYVTHDQIEAMSLGQRAAIMRSGKVVQCASPAELYAHPVDIFVARFIGTPPMNTLLARVEPAGDGVALHVGSLTIHLGEWTGRWPGLGDRVGSDIAVGIRPESLALDDEGELVVEITHIEYLGSHQLVAVTIDDRSVRQPDVDVVIDEEPTSTIVAALTAEVEVNLWKPIHLRADLSEIHLFDLETGLRLRTQPE